MKYFVVLSSFLLCQQIFAQLPEDALRMSWTFPSGTARQQALGGAMGSLGGDISSNFVNPAGLGVYKTGEFVVSPGFRFQTDKSFYRGTDTKGSSASNFNLGATGFVIGLPGENGSSTAISLAVNRTANFGSNVSYSGQNDYSSFSEQYVEEYARSGLSIDEALNSTQLSYGTREALYSYLIDTATIGGVLQVIGQPQKILNAHGILNQQYNKITKGGITEIALGLAGNFHNKWYIGGSICLPIIDYTHDMTFTESDATGDGNNDFSTSTYKEHYHSEGAGVNIKLGGIYRPDDSWRIGLAVHTPTFYTLNDDFNSSMSTNTEQYTSQPQPINITSADLDAGSGVSQGTFKYYFTSPWKFILSGSYILGEGSDVKSQKGFVTADAEFTTVKSSRFSTADEYTDPSYFDGVNSAIKAAYKGTFAFRLGGELKFNTIAARAGFSYYTDPYQEATLKVNQMFVAGGLGYRDKGIFIDLTYVLGIGKDVNFPYRLSDKANTYAAIDSNSGTILLTAGFKF